jgi:hypothetical protein
MVLQEYLVGKELKMRHAVMHNGIVVNVVLIDPIAGETYGYIPTEEASVGWSFDGEKFIQPEIDIDLEKEGQKKYRNNLLAETDPVVLPDRWSRMTAEQQQAWSDYRQALRDVPLQEGFPLKINWPTKPE